VKGISNEDTRGAKVLSYVPKVPKEQGPTFDLRPRYLARRDGKVKRKI
jgi:hypothetical protein